MVIKSKSTQIGKFSIGNFNIVMGCPRGEKGNIKSHAIIVNEFGALCAGMINDLKKCSQSSFFIFLADHLVSSASIIL